jgi:transmembrane sensor
MSMQRFIALVAKKTAGEATEEELLELERLLQGSDDLRQRYRILQQFLRESGQTGSYDTELALQRTLARIHGEGAEQMGEIVPPEKRRPVKRKLAWLSAAAVLAAMLYAGYRFLPGKGSVTPQQKSSKYLTRQNGKGMRSTIALADGSRIWLNADSRLTYPPTFNGSTREVRLQGEAFFDVADRAGQPFIIHLSGGTVQVLGTSFNIRAYDNEPLQTSVASGKVAFIPRHDGNRDTFYITPDTKLIYSQNSNRIVKQTTRSVDDKAWTEGRLIFKAATLEEIALQLERTFGKKAVFSSDAPRRYILTGSFQDNSLEEILYYLSRSKEFHYTITDNELLISE